MRLYDIDDIGAVSSLTRFPRTPLSAVRVLLSSANYYFLVTVFSCSFRFPDISIDTSISRMISLDNAFTTYYSSTKLMTVKSESNASSSMVPLAPR